MNNQKLIAEIEEKFKLIENVSSAQLEKLILQITRSINRLKTEDSQLSLTLKQLAADMQSSLKSEKEFFLLRNPNSASVNYSESFFKSLKILRDELQELIKRL